MPAGPRIRDNGAFGNVSDNPLTSGATTFNSPELIRLGPVAGGHAVVTLDPLYEFGDPEIVIVTAHTSMATVATIQRGAYGTTARSHPQGTLWVHAAIDEDYIEIVGSPTADILEPYENQLAWDSVGDLYRFDGVVWNPLLKIEAGYARNTATQNATGSTIVDLTSLSVTVDIPVGHVVQVNGSIALGVSPPDQYRLHITDGSNNILQRRDGQGPSAGAFGIDIGYREISAGTKTYKLRGRSEGAGTNWNIFGSSNLFAWIQVLDLGVD